MHLAIEDIEAFLDRAEEAEGIVRELGKLQYGERCPFCHVVVWDSDEAKHRLEWHKSDCLSRRAQRWVEGGEDAS